ncbi:hypothetical protein CAP36_06095 [Chitinophagaceae bacterium IBVUCB2]|nr:hypothetical protein CAP36_06095 [Chitinophagaceae bacterium IBVUCB2]
MKRNMFTLLFAVGFVTMASSQAYEGTIQYDKKKQRAVMIDYGFTAEAVENAFVQKMARLGYKPKEEKGILNKDKGFLVFKNSYVTDISSERMDYIVKVERKSRKEKDEAVLYVILSRDEKNLMDALSPEDIGRAKSYLNNLLPDVEAASLELEIKAQEEAIAKAEKKLRDLRDDQASLEKKLADNKTDQENTQKDIENQRQSLGVLMGKRKPSF